MSRTCENEPYFILAFCLSGSHHFVRGVAPGLSHDRLAHETFADVHVVVWRCSRACALLIWLRLAQPLIGCQCHSVLHFLVKSWRFCIEQGNGRAALGVAAGLGSGPTSNVQVTYYTRVQPYHGTHVQMEMHQHRAPLCASSRAPTHGYTLQRWDPCTEYTLYSPGIHYS